MKLSISALVAIAMAASAYAAVVARVEGDVTDAPAKVYSTALVPRLGPVVTCYNTGTKADRSPIVSVIDDWCGYVTVWCTVTNGQTVWVVLVSGEAINGCSFVIDGNCNRLLREPVDQCNTGGVNGKQGGYETDLCGQWRTDPGSNGSDF
ncbi:hypothetical protein B0H10DRAFT_2026554 [Mycena sp. CBHHK59/15]|nr:hypothetical protein B0H10DRAFT_2026554 [Mycena sp. CBHHK59/15]